MANIDRKTFFAALGFFAVILSDAPSDKQAERAGALAKLIEEFCSTTSSGFTEVPSEDGRWGQADQLLEVYIAELRDTGSAPLDHDRQTLADMYELLLFQKILNEQKEFCETGPEDMIASRILQLAEEKIQRGEYL